MRLDERLGHSQRSAIALNILILDRLAQLIAPMDQQTCQQGDAVLFVDLARLEILQKLDRMLFLGVGKPGK